VAEQGGNLTGGLDWAKQLSALAANTDRGVAYTTWLDGPDQGDNPQDESPIAYIASVARPLGLGLAGENTGGTSIAIMKLCAQRAQRYGLSGVMWMSARVLAATSGGLSEYSSFVSSQASGSTASPSPNPAPTHPPGTNRTVRKPAKLIAANFERLSRRQGVLRLHVRARRTVKTRVQFSYDGTSLVARRTIHRGHVSDIRLHVLGLAGHGPARLRLTPMTSAGHRHVISRRVHVRPFGHRHLRTRTYSRTYRVGRGPARLMM
jgi:hypothetical protein